ncbi:GNAT family N-acetyltransferase [Mucilaginibacter conchicola]|uniref:GNAT family N-acetyltransferase n=1 Tax=Mucilaginibacter conchicola TaxID=2303333 RepID=A0A372NNS7_9SPHI|nr:GNAT family N-acetyltransferase [Mucilaginibacter conchicola]RFZ90290.1 GNAT family N-acetyltransferase [Mucilaginibacter conchicola]
MNIQIEPTRIDDLDEIFHLYNEAIAYQKKVGNNHWLGFEREMVEQELAENRHFKILGNGHIIGTFLYTLSDPLIWKDANAIPAIYIHRIATNPVARGNNLVEKIIEWSKAFAAANQLQYIRIDTGAGNDRLINYYIKCGFTYLGDTKVDYTPDLPLHYKDGSFALLQLAV